MRRAVSEFRAILARFQTRSPTTPHCERRGPTKTRSRPRARFVLIKGVGKGRDRYTGWRGRCSLAGNSTVTSSPGFTSPPCNRGVRAGCNATAPANKASDPLHDRLLMTTSRLLATVHHRLAFFGNHARLTDPKAFAALLAPLRKAEWVVYSKRPFGGPEAVLALSEARPRAGSPISLPPMTRALGQPRRRVPYRPS